MMRLWSRSAAPCSCCCWACSYPNLVGIAVYSGERLDVLTSARGRQIAEQVVAAAAALQETPEDDRRRLLRSMRQPGLRLFWATGPFTGEDAGGWRGRLIRNAFLAEFGSVESERLRLSIGPRYTPPPDADDRDDERPGRRHGQPRGVLPGSSPNAPNLSVLVGSYRLDDGSWLNFAAPVATFRPFWATPFFLVIVGKRRPLSSVFPSGRFVAPPRPCRCSARRPSGSVATSTHRHCRCGARSR